MIQKSKSALFFLVTAWSFCLHAVEPQNLFPPIMEKEKSRFLNGEGRVHPHIVTTTGLALLAQKYYKGDIPKARNRGRMILQAYGQNPELLFWFPVDMDSKTFFKKQRRLYNEDDTLKEIYRHPEGQARYASQWHKNDMYSAYEEGLLLLKIPKISLLFPEGQPFPNQLSLLLPVMTGNIFTNIQRAISTYPEKALFRHLGWTTSPLLHSARTWQNERRFFVDRKGQVRPEWQDTAGQIQYARQHTEGSMQRAWEKQLYVFGESPALNWRPSFFVSADQAEEIITSFLDDNKHLKLQYRGTWIGDTLYAVKHTAGDLNQAFKNSLYLPSHLQQALDWHRYAGSVEDRKRDQDFIRKNPGMPGLLKLARFHYKGQPIKAYRNALAIFKGDKKKLQEQTGYLPFYNHVETFGTNNTIPFYERDKKNLIQEKGRLNSLYRGLKGYVRFANEYYAGDMHTAYYNAKAVLENRFSENGWILFPGTTTEFQEMAQHEKSYGNKVTGLKVRLVESFMKANNLISHYKGDMEAKVHAFLKIKEAEKIKHSALCENRGFI